MRAETILFSLLMMSLVACTDAPDFSDTPEIALENISGNRFKQSTLKDTIFIQLSYQDGDGDIGTSGDLNNNVFLLDSRDSSLAFSFSTPRVPEQGAANGVEGTLTLKAVFNKGDICCIFPSGQSPCTPSDDYPVDTFYYLTTLVDRAGNESNRVAAGPIIIECDDPN